MRGIGDVYRAYAEGRLEDDDEVAVAHADAGHGFRALSDAMVDVRATLDAAVAAGVVRQSTADSLGGRVKATFYAERALVAALDRDDEEHERLRAWLPEGRVERKREDALALLRAIRHDLDRGPRPVPSALDAAAGPATGRRRAARSSSRRAASPDRPPTRRSRRCSTRLASMRKGSAGSPTARCSPRWHGMPPPRPASTSRRGRTRPRWRRSEGHWASSNRTTSTPGSTNETSTATTYPPSPGAWRRCGGRATRTATQSPARWRSTLRSDDAYAGLAARAARKREVLASLPSDRATPADDELVEWYFRERLEREVPVALDAWATAHGWRRVADLVRALRDEWSYRAACDKERRDSLSTGGRPRAGPTAARGGGTAEVGRRPTT